MRSGLKFSLKSGEYYPLTISPLNPRKCWEPEFQYALRDIAGDTYPQADYVIAGDDAHVLFSKLNSLGFEVLRRSKPFDQRQPSSAEIHRVQEQIEKLHALANDCNMPGDMREFFKNLRLPNPHYMPECWRTTGLFKKRLYIIWGLARDGVNTTFMPASANSAAWEDKKNRISIGEATGVPSGSRPGRNGSKYSWLRWLIGSLLILLLLSLARGCLRGCVPGSCMGPTRYGSGIRKSTGGGSGGPEVGGGGSGDIGVVGECDGIGVGESGCGGGDKPGAGGSTGGECVTEDLEEREDPADQRGAEEKNSPVSGDKGCPQNDQGGAPDSPTGGSPRNADTPSNSPCHEVEDLGSGQETVQSLAYKFKVNPPRELSGGDENVAKVEFSVSPVDDLRGKSFEVLDWMVNEEVKLPGKAETFAPDGGLRYDKTYTISALVIVDGRRQRVEPYQWNMVDSPTWQIVEVGGDKGDKRRYKLICCNSSSVKPQVKDWRVAFRPGGKSEKKVIEFDHEKTQVGLDQLELDWGIGRYKGVYFVEMSVDVQYISRGKTNETTHVEIFPFTHDSSADGLTEAKYEVVIPHVYFCLAKLQDGSLINGTAFAISEKRLISNYHVAVGGIPECYANSGDYKVVGPVMLTNVKGKTFYAKVEHSDRGRDLAILSLCDKMSGESDDRLPGYLHLAEDSLLSGISETAARYVFAVGYPKGTVCMGPPAFTDGKAEKIFKRKDLYDTILNYTSTKCGYSGGPLIDYQTETVLGVNFGGLVELLEGHKAAALATSAKEVRLGFPSIKRGN